MQLVIFYLNSILNILFHPFIFLLCIYPSALIISVIHEAGHYMANKVLGLEVSKFSIGGGKRPLFVSGIFEFGLRLDSFVRTANPEKLKEDKNQNIKVSFLMSAGLIMQLLLALIVVFMPANSFTATLALMNIAIFLVNALPITLEKFQTDGGKIFKTIECMIARKRILDVL